MSNQRTIYIRNKNGHNDKIYDERLIETGIPTVDDLNTQLCQAIFNDRTSRTYLDITIHSGDITLNVLYVMRFRGCTIYLCVQQSSMGERLLAYIDPRRKHSSTSFITTEESVDNAKIIRYFQEKLAEVGIQYSTEKITEMFGI
jgi:hypothetical protein